MLMFRPSLRKLGIAAAVDSAMLRKRAAIQGLLGVCDVVSRAWHELLLGEGVALHAFFQERRQRRFNCNVVYTLFVV
jgi:hypothetical protein